MYKLHGVECWEAVLTLQTPSATVPSLLCSQWPFAVGLFTFRELFIKMSVQFKSAQPKNKKQKIGKCNSCRKEMRCNKLA